jgi:hypothetical protein
MLAGVGEPGDLGLKGFAVGGLLVGQFAEGHGVLVQLTSDAPGEEPPEAGEGVGSDDEHGGMVG